VSKKRWFWIGIVVGGLMLVSCCAAASAPLLLMGGGSLFPWGSGVALIEIRGVIASEPVYTLSGLGTGSRIIIEQLRSAEEDPNVKAVLLYINSPGGSVVASDEIYQQLKKMDKPVLAYLGDIAASGAYYVACGADKIMAHPASLTGSIGVIVEMPNVEKLMQKLGIEMTVIKSGPFKDEGSFYRGMTEEEKAYWQGLVNQVHEMFVDVVAKERGLPKEKVAAIADGRVYLGKDALEMGLVDELGSFEDALTLAAEMGGISGRPRIIRYRTAPGLLDLLFSGSAFNPRWLSEELRNLLPLTRSPALLYMYKVYTQPGNNAPVH